MFGESDSRFDFGIQMVGVVESDTRFDFGVQMVALVRWESWIAYLLVMTQEDREQEMGCCGAGDWIVGVCNLGLTSALNTTLHCRVFAAEGILQVCFCADVVGYPHQRLFRLCWHT